MAPVKTPLYNDVSGEKMTPFNFGRAIASFLVGIPTALATSVLVGTAYLMVEAANLCHSSIVKDGFKKKLVEKPGFKAASEFLEKAFFGVWTGFGVYGYLKAAEGLVQAANTFRVRHGEMDPPHDTSPGTSPQANIDQTKILKEVANIVANFFKPSNNVTPVAHSPVVNALMGPPAAAGPSASPSSPGGGAVSAGAATGSGSSEEEKRKRGAGRRAARRERKGTSR